MRRTGIATLLALLLLAVNNPALAQQSNKITVAVVQDGPSRAADLAPLIEVELGRVIPNAEIVFKAAPAFDAKWDTDQALQAVRAALADPEVEYVLLTGAMVTRAAATGGIELTKPVLSCNSQAADIFDLPISEDGRSLIPNMTFVTLPRAFEDDIEMLSRMVSFDTLHVALGEDEAVDLENYRSALDAFGQKISAEIVVLPISGDPAVDRSRVGPSVQAAVVGRTPRLTSAQRAGVFTLFSANGIPTFSLVNHKDVGLGCLAALTPDFDKQVIRRTALNISQLERGAAINDLSVVITVENSLLINAKTAAEIGYRPGVGIKAEATFTNPEYLESDAKPLTLAEAQRTAEERNLRLLIKDTNVEATRRTAQVVRGPMLPQVNAQVRGQELNNDFLTQILPQSSVGVGFNVTQMIYDDRFVQDYRSSKRIYEGNVQDREVRRLNIVTDSGDAFLKYVLARVLYQISLDNYQLTADNLELSKERLEVGYSGRDEVFRWEAQLAGQRINVFDREASAETQRIELNQILAIEQSTRWIPQEIEVKSDEFYFLDGRVTGVFYNADTFERFRQLMVRFAIENAPELRVLASALEAQSIQLGQRKRQFILPNFGLSFDYNYQFARDPDVPGADRDLWVFELFAQLPIFTGASRYYDVQRLKSQVAGLEYGRDLASDRVERGAREALRRLESSYPSIQLSRDAAESAKRNLDIVQEKYSQGIVNVTDLLQAQNSSFTANQQAALATYGFLLDLNRFQRSIAWFQIQKTAEQQTELVDRIRTTTGLP